MARVLFILKRRDDYNHKAHAHVGLSTGLYNSVKFVNDMLNSAGIESKLFVAIDNNCIDREVRNYQPTHVIIEALWVVPTKFHILTQLHPTVNWIIRLHSEMPFIAAEGIAMDWIADYVRFAKVNMAVNAPRMLDETRFYLKHIYGWSDEHTNQRVTYLPNFYPQDYTKPKSKSSNSYIDISCFGAIRPLKNHLLQALCAVQFADSIGKKLRFHVNAGRIEMKGEPMLNNLKGMFQHLADSGHQLISHTWVPREEFLEICAKMDMGMQVSLSETFNIVAADHLSQGVPVVGSREIPWASSLFTADPVESRDIVKKLSRTWDCPWINVKLNQFELTNYTDKTRDIWVKYFNIN